MKTVSREVAILGATRAGAMSNAPASSERILRIEVVVNATVDTVWELWSSSAGAQTFIAPKANIDVKLGGAYEIFFNPADERMSTKGCKVLSYVPNETISFEWNLPKDEFPELIDELTWVVVEMYSLPANRTQIVISELGWGRGPTWDRAYAHMEKGWQMLAAQLAQRFEKGPIDWETQHMMWKERAAKQASART